MNEPPGAGGEATPRDVYLRRRDEAAAQVAALAGRSRAFSWARLAVALAAVFLLLALLLEATAPPAWPFAALAAAVALFVALAVAHGRVIARQRRAAGRLALQEEGLARLERRWADLPPSPPAPLEARAADGTLRPVVRDLGLFGPVSLARLVGTARTPAGRRELGRWLLDPAPPETLRRRQPAVAELAADLELRQRLELAGRLAAAGHRDADAESSGLDRFLAWAEGEPWLLARPWLVWTSRLVPLLTVALALAAVAGLVPGSLAALPPVAALVLTWSQRGATEAVFERIDAGPGELATYAAALDAVAGRRFTSPALVDVSRRLTSEGTSAATWMRRLARRVESADARHGSFHVFNQVLTLWDFHALWALERWQVTAGRDVRRWLEALAELEALAALGTLAWENPRWCFPELTDGTGSPQSPAPVLAGRDLGHPFLADDVRVGNDVTVGPPGRVLLVTGSNMSGKSTLLRALGTNVTLGQAGGPVCAARLTLPPLELGTSILVEDSLADGVSFFYAELLRLKDVVDRADATRGEGGRTLLYLLDEVLRGTNSRERQVAVVRVLRHLIEAGAIGALSTHDLELGSVPEIARAADPVHFRETIHPPQRQASEPGGARMSFDYRLRPGPATTTNALALLAAVGLDDEVQSTTWTAACFKNPGKRQPKSEPPQPEQYPTPEEQTMGLFDFVKDAGEKIFGRDKDDQKTMGDQEREAKAEQGRELMQERRQAAAIVDFINGLDLDVDDLSVKVDDSTATVSGKVPSHEVREKVILAAGNTRGIARVDDRLDVTGTGVSASDDSAFYTVKSGDTLSGIAKAHYGDASAYMRIFEANRPMLKDPDKIYPGQTLRIPPKG